ncbi:MAG: hypothetical protein J6E40_12375 [Lachnospiraceae bacterium]|nr:hypothetical protein [Lachnospiraceae bacterium]MBP3900831.1 hypothetical protein [Blautia sp.]
MTKLKLIEEELAGCVKADRKNWVKIYQLMHEVEVGRLYEQRDDTPSFTSWVNALADELNVHVSLLWARLKAGRSYTEYEERAANRGKSVTPLAELSVSPDSLNLCEKVAGKNAAEMDRLIDKVVAGELTREDLRAAARAKRAGGGSMPATRHDRIDAAGRTEDTERVTASDIAMALRQSTWLSIADDEERKDYLDRKYHVFTEFRIQSGTSRNVRRIDAMVAETCTLRERDEVVLRGIEIKVDKNDLLNDRKMQEYTQFCDYFYIGIPADDQEMLDAADSVRRPSWGVLTVSKDGAVSVIREPERLNAVFRDKTIANCLIKLL